MPRLLTCGSGGGWASKERYLDYVCPHRGCDPRFLYGFEARILTQVAFGTNGPCGNVIIQRARASAPRNFMDSVSECPLIIFGEERQDSSQSEVGQVLPDYKRGGLILITRRGQRMGQH